MEFMFVQDVLTKCCFYIRSSLVVTDALDPLTKLAVVWYRLQRR